ncbi:MAG: hypothetical protein JRD89_05040 [Deltaproteobacteria bacterium]|nr:hypothetical protein [Deltaproteobacteria bacterium]
MRARNQSRTGYGRQIDVADVSVVRGLGIDHNYGTATINADGTSTSYTIAHGLVFAPSYVDVNPKAGAPAPDSIDVDGTNITLTFSTAPASGTYYYWWKVAV